MCHLHQQMPGNKKKGLKKIKTLKAFENFLIFLSYSIIICAKPTKGKKNYEPEVARV